MKKKQIQHYDYSLEYRYRLKSGEWSKWHLGHGQWISLEVVQRQIKMIVMSHKSDIEIKFFKDGKLIDYNGLVTGNVISYEARR